MRPWQPLVDVIIDSIILECGLLGDEENSIFEVARVYALAREVQYHRQRPPQDPRTEAWRQVALDVRQVVDKLASQLGECCAHLELIADKAGYRVTSEYARLSRELMERTRAVVEGMHVDTPDVIAEELKAIDESEAGNESE